MQEVDFIIVGQGLAGTMLGISLRKRGVSFVIIDDNHSTSCSIIAAGVTHPMSFKRTILSWKGDSLFPYAKQYYSQVENEFDVEFYEDKPLFRLIASVEEQNNWAANSADEPLKSILSEPNQDEFKSLNNFNFNAENGFGKVGYAGRLNLERFLNYFKNIFSKEDSLKNSAFNFSELQLQEDKVVYQGISAKKIIFCEGFRYKDNPYFSYLPQNLTKGEILHIKSSHFPNEFISKGIFTYPLGEDEYVVGATYRWHDYSLDKTDDAKSELIDKLNAIGEFDYEIIDHRVGVRPTVPDRRPLIGLHPQNDKVAIFNGMGSKGVLFAPYLADKFVSFLIEGTEIDREVNISRFSKKHLQKCTAFI